MIELYANIANEFKSDDISATDILGSVEFHIPIAAIQDTHDLLCCEDAEQTVQNIQSVIARDDRNNFDVDFEKAALPFDKCLVSYTDASLQVRSLRLQDSEAYVIDVNAIYFDAKQLKYCVFFDFKFGKDKQQMIFVSSPNNQYVKLPKSRSHPFFWEDYESRTRVCIGVIVRTCLTAFVLSNLDIFPVAEEHQTKRTYRLGANKKRIEYINRVVVLKAPTKQQKALVTKKKLEFSHRFEVRGHWRKVNRFGHDQNGNLIQGKTWVRPCIKGPETKPLVKKIRVIPYD